MITRIIVCFFIVVCISSYLHCQEIELPFDQSGSIYEITPELSRKLNVFTEVNGFQSAKLFQVNDSLFLLEISWQQNEKSLRKREQLSSTQVTELREKISHGLNHSNTDHTLNQSGRSTFLNTMIGLSFGYYGWSVPFLLNDPDPKLAVGTYICTAGAFCLLGHALIENSEITKEGGAAFQYSATRGIVHGSALYSIIAGKSSESNRWFVPASSLVSIIEGMTLMSSAQKNKTPLGNIYSMGVVEDFGIGMGVGSAFLIREGDALTLESKDLRLLGSSVLGGSVAGYLIGRMMIGSTTYSSGDADILQTAALLGMSSGFSIADLAGVEKRKPLVASSMGGAAVGLAIGHLLTNYGNFSEASGTSIRLYTSLGTVIGLGAAYTSSSESSDRTIYVSLATLGAVVGFTLAYITADYEPVSTSTSHSWNVKFDPLGLQQKILTSRGTEVTIIYPALRFEHRF